MASPENEIQLAHESNDASDQVFHLNNAIFILEAEGHSQYADELRTEVNEIINRDTA